MIQKFSVAKKCSGCMACYNICPKNVISMIEDKNGYKYPDVDCTKCVKCNACVKVCNYNKNSQMYDPLEIYAAVAEDTQLMKQSASGGVFSALAKSVVQQGGIVYGCAYDASGEGLTVKHIRVDNIAELGKLAGSKYVQSYIGNCYNKARNDLEAGKKVLFSGTPCQIDGLRGYLKREYDNLVCIDIICHGVPNQKIFDGYIKYLEKKVGNKIVDFKFRDKAKGWGLQGSYTYIDDRQEEKTVLLDSSESSYYQFFLGGDIYRENCYECKYAKSQRCGDITIGDFWGIEDAHPEIMQANGGRFDVKRGISCILLNTEKAVSMMRELDSDVLNLYESSLEKVRETNQQLKNPSKKGKHRTIVLFLFQHFGYGKVEEYWKIYELLQQVKRTLKRKLGN